ncbi:MAG: GNAT family N-acetyltransferase [Actinomycetota bacterium]|nr:MAG: GNAT family N-acetyltransferase [Actinomycetota bacterium]
MFVDDLVTSAQARSRGAGTLLFNELQKRALHANCDYLELDSGVANQRAHVFYQRLNMTIAGVHFMKNIR